jgi:hypothetical protein
MGGIVSIDIKPININVEDGPESVGGLSPGA